MTPSEGSGLFVGNNPGKGIVPQLATPKQGPNPAEQKPKKQEDDTEVDFKDGHHHLVRYHSSR